MKRWTALLAVFFVSIATAQEFPTQEVMEMHNKDKDLRIEWIRKAFTNQGVEIGKKIRRQEINNTVRLKEILDLHGLPTDYEASEAITKLVLLSSDLQFQKEFLDKAAEIEEWSQNLEEITDRVLIKQGFPQRYGTHGQIDPNGHLELYPIEDLSFVNEHQAKYGEPPLEASVAFMQNMYDALCKDDIRLFYKYVFNITHGFFENMDDYLYYTTFEQGNSSLNENGEMVAFDDPGVSIFYALVQKAALSTLNHQLTTTDLISLPIYTYLVRKNEFDEGHIFEFSPVWEGVPYTEAFLATPYKVYSSKNRVEPVAEIPLDTVPEGLVYTGIVEVPEFNLKAEFLYQLYFIMTPQYDAQLQ